MKTKHLIASLFCGICSIKAQAQITYEQSYSGPNSTSEARLQLIDMGVNEYKYSLVNYATNQLSLYNLDHSTYATVTIPIALVNSGEYSVGYVTRTLFDCDSTQFEYAILPQYGLNNFYIYREDGTLLFQKDSTIAPYCFGCFGGAYDVRPIINSPVGAKLFLLKNTPLGYMTTDVYSLCGKLPVNGIELNAASASFVKVFPNPSSGETTFEFDLKSNTHDHEIVIFDASGQQVHSMTIKGTVKSYSLDESILHSGVYFFTVQTENKVIQNGKFIIVE